MTIKCCLLKDQMKNQQGQLTVGLALHFSISCGYKMKPCCFCSNRLRCDRWQALTVAITAIMVACNAVMVTGELSSSPLDAVLPPPAASSSPLLPPHPVVKVVGKVYCYKCFDPTMHPLGTQHKKLFKGATVKVTCKAGDEDVRAYGRTDGHGRYRITVDGILHDSAKSCKVELHAAPAGSICSVPTRLNVGAELEDYSAGHRMVVLKAKPLAFAPEKPHECEMQRHETLSPSPPPAEILPLTYDNFPSPPPSPILPSSPPPYLYQSTPPPSSPPPPSSYYSDAPPPPPYYYKSSTPPTYSNSPPPTYSYKSPPAPYYNSPPLSPSPPPLSSNRHHHKPLPPPPPSPSSSLPFYFNSPPPPSPSLFESPPLPSPPSSSLPLYFNSPPPPSRFESPPPLLSPPSSSLPSYFNSPPPPSLSLFESPPPPLPRFSYNTSPPPPFPSPPPPYYYKSPPPPLPSLHESAPPTLPLYYASPPPPPAYLYKSPASPSSSYYPPIPNINYSPPPLSSKTQPSSSKITSPSP